ncbi:hypothetical protein F8M41_007568 [Gigaspora margarita]|uniref:Uncharacterized protein n=1 Tax=Gigaspora margarita TaxID=4874 RepID=A0A8H4A4D6_GIGMA|nr:hypothetical protein F8M41_007568 [Gigaspora margarita]
MPHSNESAVVAVTVRHSSVMKGKILEWDIFSDLRELGLDCTHTGRSGDGGVDDICELRDVKTDDVTYNWNVARTDISRTNINEHNMIGMEHS